MTGYQHPLYAASLAEFGSLRDMPNCRGWILQRQIPGTTFTDAIGEYPIFSCQNWAFLRQDLEALTDEMLSVSLVADPFGGYTRNSLSESFDIVAPFKEHFVIDLERCNYRPSKHHRYYARTALRSVEVEISGTDSSFANEWWPLYQNLSRRHGITGLRAFSLASFRVQLTVPGLVIFKLLEAKTLVGAHLWYVQDDVAYSHLAAVSDRGYELGCMYGGYWSAIDYFKTRVRWLELGAGAGMASTNDGLARFKSGWATGTRPAYFCGRILNRAAYARLCGEDAISTPALPFPAYRRGRFD